MVEIDIVLSHLQMNLTSLKSIILPIKSKFH